MPRLAAPWRQGIDLGGTIDARLDLSPGMTSREGPIRSLCGRGHHRRAAHAV